VHTSISPIPDNHPANHQRSKCSRHALGWIRTTFRFTYVARTAACSVATGQRHRIGSWIWSPDATLQSAPEGSRFFRRTFEISARRPEATLEITCDNHFTVWINGKPAGSGDEWQQMQALSQCCEIAQLGKNAIAVEAQRRHEPSRFAGDPEIHG
jgi:hypothetical protein